MGEFWICQVCKSVNRPSAGRCYGCHSRRGERAPEAQAVKKAPAAPAGPFDRAAPAAQPALPLSAGVNVAAPPRSAAGYFGQSGPPPAPAYRPRRRLGRPAFLRLPNRFRPAGYVTAWRFGYVTAAVLGAVLVVGLLLGAILSPAVVASVRDRTIDPLQTAARPGGSAYVLEIVFVALGVVALVMFSAFVGFSTRNAPLLGAETPPLTPGRAAWSWPNVVWSQGRLAVMLLVPPVLFGVGLGIPACIVALVQLEWLQRHSTQLTDWLAWPARHLVDLYDRLGLKGVGSLLVRTWRMAFVAANVLLMAIWLVPLGVAATHQLSLFRRESLPPSDGLEPPQLAVLALAGAFAVALAATIGLLVPITAELSQRQRVRRTLVIAGLARPWVGPGVSLPGEPTTPTFQSEPDWEDRPAVRWSDLGASDREAWERSLEIGGPFQAGMPRD